MSKKPTKTSKPPCSTCVHSVQPYIDYHKQPYSRFIPMNEYNRRFNTMLFDPNVEQQIKQQLKEVKNLMWQDLQSTELLANFMW